MLKNQFGDEAVKTDAESLSTFGKDWTTAYQPDPLAVVLPRDIGQVIALVKLANEKGFALVPSGGRTGLSGGAVARNQEVVVAFDRMNRILAFDPVDRQVVCEPGVITEELQQFAQEQGLFYPVDFASSGSSQIGGNVATNAGGIKVIRYGMTRQWVLGLKVVTGTGELLELNRGLVKNATGYDFRHLFIGSEGTLGLIVEVTLALASPPSDPTVLLLAVTDLPSCMEVLKQAQQKFQLSAFEFFSEPALGHVIAEKGLQRPFETRAPFYALIEFENDADARLDDAMTLFESCLEAGWVLDGTISQSVGQAESLWRLREDISETISRFSPYKNDISVKVSRVPEFLSRVDELVSARYPDFEIIWFGHIGDGNVHLNILKPAELDLQVFQEQCGKVSKEVFQLVKEYGGSVSAEHGVGLLKKAFLTSSRDPAEISYMRAVKKVFDPNGIMNPGKIFDSET
ncbi:MAG: FAD-binding oxidoreductase [Gammaproteobacteria bacterium]